MTAKSARQSQHIEEETSQYERSILTFTHWQAPDCAFWASCLALLCASSTGAASMPLAWYVCLFVCCYACMATRSESHCCVCHRLERQACPWWGMSVCLFVCLYVQLSVLSFVSGIVHPQSGLAFIWMGVCLSFQSHKRINAYIWAHISVVKYNTAKPYFIVFYHIILHYTIFYRYYTSIIPYCTVLYCIIPFFTGTIPYYTVLYRIILYYTVLYCIFQIRGIFATLAHIHTQNERIEDSQLSFNSASQT
jgi:hypothetical protein